MATTTVIIPNWNGQHLLAPCLLALAAQTDQDCEVVLVDNGSQDGSVEWVRSHFPSVRILAQERNLGFAAAVNQGILASDSRYVVTLNNDTEPEPGWLAALVSRGGERPDRGHVRQQDAFRRPAGDHQLHRHLPGSGRHRLGSPRRRAG